MWAKTTIGVEDERPARSFSSQASWSGAQAAHAAGLQVHDIDQGHEVHAAMVEAVPARALGSLAVAVEEGLARALVQHVVLARHVEHGEAGFLEDLVGVVELLVARQLGDVAGVDDEVRLDRQGQDLAHGLAEGGLRVGVGRLVEADVAVADLQEREALGGPVGRGRGLVEADRAGQPAAHREQRARAGPGHALEESAPVVVVVIVHLGSLDLGLQEQDETGRAVIPGSGRK
jgi:hypothetical protein